MTTRFSSVSAPSERLLISLLSNIRSVQKFIEISSEECILNLLQGWNKWGIECLKSNGGIDCWADMSLLMPSSRERVTWALGKTIECAMVNATPGSICHFIELDCFRFYLTTFTKNNIPIVIERIWEISKNCKSRSLNVIYWFIIQDFAGKIFFFFWIL